MSEAATTPVKDVVPNEKVEVFLEDLAELVADVYLATKRGEDVELYKHDQI